MLALQVREKVKAELRKSGFVLTSSEDGHNTEYYEKRLNEKLLIVVVRVSNRYASLFEWKSRYGGNEPRVNPSPEEIKGCGGDYGLLSDKYFEKEFYSIVLYDPQVDVLPHPFNAGVVDTGLLVDSFPLYNIQEMTSNDFSEIRNRIRSISHGSMKNQMTESVYMPLRKIQEWMIRLGCYS